MRTALFMATLCMAGAARAADTAPAQHAMLTPVPPSDVVLTGYLGERLDANLHGILLHKNENMLLDPFRHRKSGEKAWAGEHVGKWLSAASMGYAYSHDKALLAKLQRVARELMATQLDDGYLGTYV